MARQTDRQALQKAITASSSQAKPYFVVRFDVDQCVAAVAKKAIIEPEPHNLKKDSTCIVRWSDNCRYEAVVLTTAENYTEAKKQEK